MKKLSSFLLFGLLGVQASSGIAEEALEEIVVTGSRIKDVNVVSSSQIAVVTGADIEDRGITRVEDYLNDLPQVSPAQSITNANGASGTATVNLRNFGCGRTLVLMNGKRMAPGTTGGGNCADLNAVPTLLLDRVEVLTGGASSVYGSDAVAGVVNFILDDDFEGFEARVFHSFYDHKNDNGGLRSLVESFDYETAPGDVTTGKTTKFAVAFGGSIFDGRGHLMAYAEKTDTDPILQGDYDIAACALSGGITRCGGSSTIPPGRWADFGLYGALGYVNVDPTVTRLDLKVLGDEFVPRAGQTFNYNPTNFFQRPDERLTSGFFGRFEVNEYIEAYADMTFMKSESNAQIAFSGTFGNITSLPCYNANLSAQQWQTICGDWTGMGGDHAPDFASAGAALAYLADLDIQVGNGAILGYEAPLYSLKRNVEGNPRQSLFAYKNFVQTVGIRGDITEDWSYDVSYQRTDINYSNEYRNDLSVIAINRAVDVVSVNGTPTCVSALDGTDPSCVPYNLFSGGLAADGGIQAVIDGGQALQNYIANATYITGDGQQNLLSAYVSGITPIAIPGAPSGISVVFGYENKDVKTDYRPDLPSRTGDRSGSGGPSLPIAGGYDVDEYYVELGIPVMENLSFDAGFRSSSYSTGQDTDTYKVGAYFRVADSVAVRGSFQTAVRHANVGELFSAQGAGLVDLDDDPCSGARGQPTATQAQCANTGLPANLYGTDLTSPADQYNILAGGNPNVKPEEAESTTIGLVLTPTAFLEGLTVTIDYFDIEVTEGIGTVSAKTALDKCVETAQAAYCDLINRHPVNGTLWLEGGYISATITNIAQETTSGVDIIFDYSMDTPVGALKLQGVTTWLSSYDVIELPGEPAIPCAGNWGGSCGKNPMPEWSGNYKATLSTEYNTDISLGMRYLGETTDLNANKINFDAFTYFDLTATYMPTENISATIGFSNLFDKDPAVTSDAGTAPGNGNTFPAYFDALGRYVYMNVGVRY